MNKYNKVMAVVFVLIAGTLWGTMGLFVRTYTQAQLGSMDIVGILVYKEAVSLTEGIGIFVSLEQLFYAT